MAYLEMLLAEVERARRAVTMLQLAAQKGRSVSDQEWRDAWTSLHLVEDEFRDALAVSKAA